MIELTWQGILLLVSVTAIAGFLRGFAGFGSGMLMAGPLVLLLEPAIAIAVIVLLEAAISLPLMKSAKKDVNRLLVRRLLLGAVFMAPVGIWTIQVLSVKTAGQVISILVVFSAIALLIGYQSKSPRTAKKDILTGGVSGFTCGLAGISGPPVVLYLLSRTHKPLIIRATLIYYFALVDFYVLGALFFIGDIGIDPFIVTAICFPIMWFSAMFGAARIATSNPARYKVWALSTIILGNVLSLIVAFYR